jgi:hypothetical protein
MKVESFANRVEYLSEIAAAKTHATARILIIGGRFGAVDINRKTK